MALNFAVNNSLSAITALPASISGGGLNLISTQTASSSANISFTSGLDSTYKAYIFKFYDIHPATNAVAFQFNLSVDGGSNYNVTKTSTSYRAYLYEDGSSGTLQYEANHDLAQSTNAERLCAADLGNDNDQSLSGTLELFDISNTNFVKHYIAQTHHCHEADLAVNFFKGGYGNTTSAIDAIQFTMSSGNIDSGTIKLYGVS